MGPDDIIATAVVLSKPAHRALAAAGIVTFVDLSRRTREDIASLHGMGPKALIVLEPAMAARGVAFRT